MIDFDTYKQILIILFSPLFTIIMFQISSVLNRTFLTTGMVLMELEDIEQLTGVSHKKIRMINKNNRSLFKILDENNTEISSLEFDENIRLISKNNIEINNDRYFELRKNKFSQLVRTKPESIEISNNGNTFTQFNVLDSGQKIPVGSITFDENTNEITEAKGIFEKLKD